MLTTSAEVNKCLWRAPCGRSGVTACFCECCSCWTFRPQFSSSLQHASWSAWFGIEQLVDRQCQCTFQVKPAVTGMDSNMSRLTTVMCQSGSLQGYCLFSFILLHVYSILSLWLRNALCTVTNQSSTSIEDAGQMALVLRGVCLLNEV